MRKSVVDKTKRVEDVSAAARPQQWKKIRPDVVYQSWYHHSCLYGHKKRVKTILEENPELDANQVCTM
jgi:hypothetical protein